MGRLADAIFGKPKPQAPGLGADGQTDGPDAEVRVEGLSVAPAPMPTEATTDPYHEKGGAKIMPQVVIERLEPHLSGDMRQVEVWATLHNASEFEVEVTQAYLFGLATPLGRYLKPGGRHEVPVYRGVVHRDDADDKGYLQYKICSNGDYFQLDHRVRYRYERTGEHEFYLPEEADPILPIRDI